MIFSNMTDGIMGGSFLIDDCFCRGDAAPLRAGTTLKL